MALHRLSRLHLLTTTFCVLFFQATLSDTSYAWLIHERQKWRGLQKCGRRHRHSLRLPVLRTFVWSK